MASMKALAAIALTLIVACPIGLGFLFATHEVPYDEWQADTTYNVTDKLLNHEAPTYITYNGVSNNTTLSSGNSLNYVTMGTNPTSYPASTVSSVTQTYAAGVWYDMSSYDSWTVQWTSWASLYYKPSDGSYISAYPANSGNTTVSNNGGSISFSSETVATVTSYVDEGQFADVSDGWHLPTLYDDWQNGQVNKSATFTIYLPNDEELRIGDIRIINTAGSVTVTYHIYPPIAGYTPPVYTFGHYNYFQAVVTGEGVTLYGLDAWPRMDRAPVSYNTLEVPWGPQSVSHDTFSTVYLRVTNNNDTVFRVDEAEALGGYFPDTLDATLNMSELYPGRSYELRLNSIGIYGDTITLAGQSYGVNLGRISVNGHTVPLKGAIISSYRSGDHFTNAINGIALGDTAAPASVYFGGEWSLTATVALMVEVTGERTEWNPGEFAFDKRDFAAVGLLVAGACLVGLGIYGQRSGVKIGLLLLICGGAALIYLTMV